VTGNATVSVVIPCFNSAATIERALRSVEHQTTKPNEVLVVDDASSDNTVSVIEQSSIPPLNEPHPLIHHWDELSVEAAF
jgi:glycosyltransferase involved in cell wall biosynthesis